PDKGARHRRHRKGPRGERHDRRPDDGSQAPHFQRPVGGAPADIDAQDEALADTLPSAEGERGKGAALSALKELSIQDLNALARELNVPGAAGMKKHDLI